MYTWDPSKKILTDMMGYPLSRSEASALIIAAGEHLKHSPRELAAIAQERFGINNPDRAKDKWDPQDFE